jgi:hypothetical protein
MNNNSNNKNNPDYSAKAMWILRMLEEDLRNKQFTQEEIDNLFKTLKLLRSNLAYTEFNLRARLDELIVKYSIKDYTDAAIAIEDCSLL